MQDDEAVDARWVLMWYILIGCWCVILAYVENCIKWSLVGHLYIVREDNMIRMKKINRYNYGQKYKFTWTTYLFLYSWGTNLENFIF